MNRQLKKMDLNFQFFDCVIGAELTEEEIAEKCNMEIINKKNEINGWFNRGIIGCTMTNQNILKTIIADGLDYALLLEDDTLLPGNLKEITEHAKTFLQQGDVVLLFYLGWKKLFFKECGIQTPFNFNYYLPQNPQDITGGSAFIVTREAAKKMLEKNTPIHSTPDSWNFFYENNCIDRLFCAYPICVDTADLRSTMKTMRKYNQIADLISKYKIFPFYQLLKWKRRNQKRNKQVVEIIPYV
jgi:glycosyl transferase family 25